MAGAGMWRKALLDLVEGGAGALGELLKKGTLVQAQREVSRLVQERVELQEKKALSEVQTKALEQVREQLSPDKPVLLHGVTSSGKTELYIHLIEEILASGRQALYLLPEIALTTQITSRLKAHFGDKLGIYHSRFSDAERVEVWQNLLSEQPYQVILGVRSAVFLPFRSEERRVGKEGRYLRSRRCYRSKQ